MRFGAKRCWPKKSCVARRKVTATIRNCVVFAAVSDPPAALAAYLTAVHDEATRRGYQFDASKIVARPTRRRIPEMRGQLLYEWRHLKRKLKRRDPTQYRSALKLKSPAPRPIFRITTGAVRKWEKISPTASGSVNADAVRPATVERHERKATERKQEER